MASSHTTDICDFHSKSAPTASCVPPAPPPTPTANQSQSEVSVSSRDSALTSNLLPVAVIKVASNCPDPVPQARYGLTRFHCCVRVTFRKNMLRSTIESLTLTQNFTKVEIFETAGLGGLIRSQYLSFPSSK